MSLDTSLRPGRRPQLTGAGDGTRRYAVSGGLAGPREHSPAMNAYLMDKRTGHVIHVDTFFLFLYDVLRRFTEDNMACARARVYVVIVHA